MVSIPSFNYLVFLVMDAFPIAVYIASSSICSSLTDHYGVPFFVVELMCLWGAGNFDLILFYVLL